MLGLAPPATGRRIAGTSWIVQRDRKRLPLRDPVGCCRRMSEPWFFDQSRVRFCTAIQQHFHEVEVGDHLLFDVR